ncbi:MAG: tetratricopeptide repeat protein [Pseudomonadota bacterium]
MHAALEKLAEIRPMLAKAPEPVRHEDEFLSVDDLVSVHRQAIEHRRQMVQSELEEIFREKKWQHALDLFMPVEEKLPELVAKGLDTAVREKIAFALGQLGRYDDAIAQLGICVERNPDSFSAHGSLAYTAYNSLFAAKNREIFLHGKVRDERIGLAHRHLKEAQRLRPDGVTNYYREGMLFHKIENKSKLALPLFVRAVANWESLETAEKERRHQEKKNYIKALFQKAGILLSEGDCGGASQSLKRCLEADEKTDHVSLLHKYFALGKVEFFQNRLKEAKDALLFAEKCRGKEPVDFVFELLARVYLGLQSPDKAMAVLHKVPEAQRRPYFRWTEADTCCALGRYDTAKAILNAANQKDRLSRHKGLIRLCKIEYLLGEYAVAMGHAREADRFFREKWTNPCADGLFWFALNAFRAGKLAEAAQAAEELQRYQPGYPKLDRLLSLVTTKEGDYDEKGGSDHTSG